jgi:flagellar basal body rod protein FlgB
MLQLSAFLSLQNPAFRGVAQLNVTEQNIANVNTKVIRPEDADVG